MSTYLRTRDMYAIRGHATCGDYGVLISRENASLARLINIGNHMHMSAIWKKIARQEASNCTRRSRVLFSEKIALKPLWLLINHTTSC